MEIQLLLLEKGEEEARFVCRERKEKSSVGLIGTLNIRTMTGKAGEEMFVCSGDQVERE